MSLRFSRRARLGLRRYVDQTVVRVAFLRIVFRR